MPNVLVIDDDPYVTKYMASLLSDHGYAVRTIEDPAEAPRVIEEFQPDATVLDLAMPGRHGLDLLPELKRLCPHGEVIIYTGTGNIEKAVEAMKRGAYDFIQKPLNYEELLLSLQRALEVHRLRDENITLRGTYDSYFGPDTLLAFSDKTRALLRLADRFRSIADLPVLIEGESGTGKELLARYIHFDESRPDRPFVAINCGAIPQTLLEAELFGYAPGAFTGARPEGAPGKIQAAEGGTLFLDEIGELDAASQVKLLRFLEHGTFFPVGSTEERQVRCRAICATNRDLASAVTKGEFRRDLYYRINVGYLRTIPLRERREEIMPFTRHFLADFGTRFGNPFEEIEPEAEKLLLHAPWKGNVRELRNTIERVVLTQRGPVLKAEFLEFLRPLKDKAESELPSPAEAPLPEDGLDLERTMLRLIERALEMNNYNQSRTARYLGITRETLRYRLRKLRRIRPTS